VTTTALVGSSGIPTVGNSVTGMAKVRQGRVERGDKGCMGMAGLAWRQLLPWLFKAYNQLTRGGEGLPGGGVLARGDVNLWLR
jgi:hypothetical protein